MIVKEKYAGQRIDSIIRILENETAAGRPKDFDIRVDELKVVPRTNKIDEFLNHEEFINAQTQSVSITLYEGNSRHYTRYVLMLKEEAPSLSEQQKTLAGIESTINEKIQQQRNQWEKELLEQELKKTKEQLVESEEYSEILEKRVSELELEKSSRSNELMTTVMGIAGSYLSKNPNALSGLPIIGNLFNGSGNKKEETKQEFEASFKAKGSSTDEVAKEQKSDSSKEDVLGTELLRYFNEEETRIVINIIYQLTMAKSILPSILSALTREVGELKAAEAAAAKATA